MQAEDLNFYSSGAEQGFLERGFICIKVCVCVGGGGGGGGVRFANLILIFLQYPLKVK